eukprot:GDKH01016767.1.p2 GENE.GDKH01016767.1~~GDKH01016767.1.p2  ORF type:complete len:70 (+),score=0.09 GDKH01016767.1:120-329(+)
MVWCCLVVPIDLCSGTFCGFVFFFGVTAGVSFLGRSPVVCKLSNFFLVLCLQDVYFGSLFRLFLSLVFR